MLSYISAAIVASSAFAAHTNPSGQRSTAFTQANRAAYPNVADQTVENGFTVYTAIDYSTNGANWGGSCQDAITTSSSQSPIDVITPVRATNVPNDSSQFSLTAFLTSPSTNNWGQKKAPRKTGHVNYDSFVDYSWEINTFEGTNKPTLGVSGPFGNVSS